MVKQACPTHEIKKKIFGELHLYWSSVERMQATFGTKARIQLNDAFATVDDIAQFITERC